MKDKPADVCANVDGVVVWQAPLEPCENLLGKLHEASASVEELKGCEGRLGSSFPSSCLKLKLCAGLCRRQCQLQRVWQHACTHCCACPCSLQLPGLREAIENFPRPAARSALEATSALQ